MLQSEQILNKIKPAVDLFRDEDNYVDGNLLKSILENIIYLEEYDHHEYDSSDSVDSTKWFVFKDNSVLRVDNPKQEVYPCIITAWEK